MLFASAGRDRPTPVAGNFPDRRDPDPDQSGGTVPLHASMLRELFLRQWEYQHLVASKIAQIVHYCPRDCSEGLEFFLVFTEKVVQRVHSLAAFHLSPGYISTVILTSARRPHGARLLDMSCFFSCARCVYGYKRMIESIRTALISCRIFTLVMVR